MDYAMLSAGSAGSSQHALAIRDVRPGEPLVRLSARESQILTLIAAGQSDRQMADVLSISRKTVSNHVTNILCKLQVQTRAAAVACTLTEPHIAVTPDLVGPPEGNPASP